MRGVPGGSSPGGKHSVDPLRRRHVIVGLAVFAHAVALDGELLKEFQPFSSGDEPTAHAPFP